MKIHESRVNKLSLFYFISFRKGGIKFWSRIKAPIRYNLNVRIINNFAWIE